MTDTVSLPTGLVFSYVKMLREVRKELELTGDSVVERHKLSVLEHFINEVLLAENPADKIGKKMDSLRGRQEQLLLERSLLKEVTVQ